MVAALATEWVFGYGSLVLELARAPTRVRHAGGYVAELRRFRRGWGVAMDNREDVPGYKRYLAADGSRPAVWVAFLDLAADPATSVNGVLWPASAAQLAALDRRERSYERMDVTDSLDEPPGRSWAYVGSEAARGRLAAGLRAGAAVVQRDYLDAVTRGFAALGADELARFEASTDPLELPVLDLRRVDLPDADPAAAREDPAPDPPAGPAGEPGSDPS